MSNVPDLVDAEVADQTQSGEPLPIEVPPPADNNTDNVEETTPMPPRATTVQNNGLPQVKSSVEVQYPPGVFPEIDPAKRGVATATAIKAHAPSDGIKYLNDLVEDSSGRNFRLEVRRLRPAVYKFHRLPLSVIEELDVVPFDALKDSIAQVHGGGEYRVSVLNTDGAVVKAFSFRIDPSMVEPVIPPNAPRIQSAQPMPSTNTRFGASPYSPGGAQPAVNPSDPLSMALGEIRTKEQMTMAQHQLLQAEHKFEKTRRQIQQEEAKEREAMYGNADKLREEMREMQRSFTDALKELGRKEDNTLPLIIKMMEQKSEQQARMMEESRRQSEKSMELLVQTMGAMFNGSKSGGSEIVEAMKMSNAANQKIVEMAVSRNDGGFQQKILDVLLAQTLNKDTNSTKQMFDMYNQGRQQTMEMMQMFDTGGGGDEVIDPDAGFMGNLGNLLIHGVKNLVTGVSSGAGSRLLSAFTPKPPPYAPVYEPAPTQPLLEAPRPQPEAQANPQPQPAQSLPVTQAAQAENVVSVASAYYDCIVADAPGGVQELGPPQQPTASHQQAQAAHQQARQQQPQQFDEETVEHVSEGIRIAVSDINAGRLSHDWPEYALGKWGHFLGHLAQAADDHARLSLIRQACDPQIYQQLSAQLGNPAHMRAFIQALHSLLAEHQEQQRGSAA